MAANSATTTKELPSVLSLNRRGDVTSTAIVQCQAVLEQMEADAMLHRAFAESGTGFQYSTSMQLATAMTRRISFDRSRTVNAIPVGISSDLADKYLQRTQRGGLIQCFGCFLLVDEGNFLILAYSENAAEMLGLVATSPVEEPQKAVRNSQQGFRVPGDKSNRLGSSLRAFHDVVRRAIRINAAKRRRSAETKVPTGHPCSREASTTTQPAATDTAHRSLSPLPPWNPFSRLAKEGAKMHKAPKAPASGRRDAEGVYGRMPSGCIYGGGDAGPGSRSDHMPLELGACALDFFTPESAAAIRKAASAGDISAANPVLVQAAALPGAASLSSFHAVFHRIDGAGLALDLEPIRPQDSLFTGEGALQAHRLAARAVRRLQQVEAGDIDLLCNVAVSEIWRLTGYDRVMAYRFHEDEHGEVTAEAKRDGVDTYLGLHFPATDIPQASRDLFLHNRARIIVDSAVDSAKVIQAPQLREPVLLTGSTLRAVHSCHSQYMKNMGIRAALTLAVIINQAHAPGKLVGDEPGGSQRTGTAARLWGLVVCHHETPRCVPYPLRLACQFLMQVFGMKLNMELELVLQQKETQVLRVQALLFDMLLRDSILAILTQVPDITDLVPCDGAALLYSGHCQRIGTTPSEQQVRDLARWLSSEIKGSIGMSTDSLADAGYPQADNLEGATCGMLAVHLDLASFVFWFRGHMEKEIRWSGARHCPGEEDDLERMHPRSSFAAFLEVVRQRALPWDDVDIDAASCLGVILRSQLTRAAEAATRAELVEEMEKLSAAEEEMSRALETAPVPVFTVGHDGCVSGWNATMAHLTGLSAGEALGKSLIQDLVVGASRPALGWALCLAFQGKSTGSIEICMMRHGQKSPERPDRAGMEAWAQDGQPPWEARNNTPGGVDAGGQVVLLVNAFGVRRLACPERAAAGDLSADRFGTPGTAAGTCQVGHPQYPEGTGASPKASSEAAGGGVAAACFVGQDLTAQRLAEGHFTKIQGDYATIIHSSNSLIPPIFAIDDEGRCTEWNAAMERTTGVSRADALGRFLLEVLFGANLKATAACRTNLTVVLERALCGESAEGHPITFTDRQGQEIHVLVTTCPRWSSGTSSGSSIADSAVVGVFGFLQMPNPELQAAMLLQRGAKQLAKEKTKKVAVLRQAMRGPLDGLQLVQLRMGTWTWPQRGSGEAEWQRGAVQIGGRCLQQLLSVASQKLPVESLEEGFFGPAVRVGPFKLLWVLEAVLSMVHPAAARGGVDLRPLQPALDASSAAAALLLLPLSADHVLLQQALSELLAAAVQFTPRGGWAELAVSPGQKQCDPASQSVVCFEFRTTHSVQPGESGGVPEAMVLQMCGCCKDKSQLSQEGLGLRIARKIVHAFKGDVWYERSEQQASFVAQVSLSRAVA